MDSTSSPVLAWIDDMVWEIVVRLSPKSLMRFKFVSKHWNKIISDPLFVKSYIGGFHGLLVSHTVEIPRSDTAGYDEIKGVGNNCFPYAHYFLEEKSQHYRHYKVTNIEKGLCVFYKPGGAFTLCNIATKELLDLPIKTPEEELVRYVYDDDDRGDHLDYCFLGFEPVRGVYKLVRHFYDDERDYLQICTLGGEDKDLNWRSIDEATLLGFFDHYICINGVLYLTAWPPPNYIDNMLLVALNLSTEIAPQSIPLPDGFTIGCELIQLDGSPGFIHLTHEVSTLWILKDNKTWAKSQSVDLMGICRVAKCESVNLTGICGFDITYLGTLPTGEVLLAPARVGKDNPVLPVYKYDHIQKKLLNWIELSCPDASYGNVYSICYHEDNIVPLDFMITRSNGSFT